MDLIRPLGLAGVRCAVVTSPHGLQTYSRFAHTIIPWDDDEIAEGADALLYLLTCFGAAQPVRPVLFYELDAQLLFVSRNRKQLSQAFRFVIADPELIEDLVNKGRFQILAERLNLPVPRTRWVKPSIEAAPNSIDIRFPVVVKPLWRRKSWGANGETAKVIQIDTLQALCEAWPRWALLGDDLLIQELIPGPETHIESYHVYIDDHGTIAGEFTGRKIRTLPTSHGHSTALTITDAADVVTLGRSLVERLGLRGVAKFDFKRDPDGRLYLLEINPRFNLWHHLGATAGVNLPALVFADLTGLSRPSTMPVRTGMRWCRFSEDWHSAKASGMPFRTWLPWALRCEATTLVWDDPMPLVHSLWRALSGPISQRFVQAKERLWPVTR
jgi:predicted ATP-grasp superfamily ATP-dependent carboligase